MLDAQPVTPVTNQRVSADHEITPFFTFPSHRHHQHLNCITFSRLSRLLVLHRDRQPSAARSTVPCCGSASPAASPPCRFLVEHQPLGRLLSVISPITIASSTAAAENDEESHNGAPRRNKADQCPPRRRRNHGRRAEAPQVPRLVSTRLCDRHQQTHLTYAQDSPDRVAPHRPWQQQQRLQRLHCPLFQIPLAQSRIATRAPTQA